MDVEWAALCQRRDCRWGAGGTALVRRHARQHADDTGHEVYVTRTEGFFVEPVTDGDEETA